ncbi:MAG: hypothetical protein RIR79_34 [Pseudomonadota bacterium]|jgi:8-oxo-dGTP pyrophosphatase MutT (NUDIX family)
MKQKTKISTNHPTDAATVLLLQDGTEGLEVLLICRHIQSNVLGGVYVFPGGKHDSSDASFHHTAQRETWEEVGVQLEIDHLIPWSRWITPRQPTLSSKRFDARFFVAAMPANQKAKHDDYEATETLWIRPAKALERYWNGDLPLAPPQIMSLLHLSHYPDTASAIAAAPSDPPLIQPEVLEENGERIICYPGDPLHPIRQRAQPGPLRWYYRNQRFEYESHKNHES